MTEAVVTYVPAASVVAGNNDRQYFDPEKLGVLAENIRKNGLMSPPTVRLVDGRYEIVAGERRVRAMIGILEWVEIPVFVRVLDDRQASEMMLVENLQRKDLGPIDESDAYLKRISDGWSLMDIAAATGRSPSRIRTSISLGKLIPQIRELVRLKTVDVRCAEKMTRLNHAGQQAAICFLGKTPGVDIYTFGELCSLLKKSEMQPIAMFDMAVLWSEEVNAGRYVQNGLKAIITVPVSEGAPEVPVHPRGNHTGQVVFDYIQVLLADDEYKDCAPVIGKLFEALVRKRLIRVPPPMPDGF